MSGNPVVQFLDETVAGELLRDHEVHLAAAQTVPARVLLQLRFGDDAARACEAFARGAFRIQVDGAAIESLDADVRLVPGLAVHLIQLSQRWQLAPGAPIPTVTGHEPIGAHAS